jgi:hypothetical protein
MNTSFPSLFPSWEKVDTAERGGRKRGRLQKPTPLPASLRSATLSHKGRGQC